MLAPVARHRMYVAAAMAIAVGAGAAGWTQAQEPPPAQMSHAEARAAVRAQTSDVSLSDAVRRVQRTTGGRILGAERVPFDGRDINRVKYMDDRGRVLYMDDPSPSRAQPRAPRNAEMPSRHRDNP